MSDNMEEFVPEESLPEAGGVAWTELHGYSGMGAPYKINLTARGKTPILALESLIQAVAYATVEFGMYPHPFKQDGNVAKPTEDPFPETLTETAKSIASKAEVKRKPVPEGGGEFTAKTIKVLPQPNSRVVIEFWNPNREYPEFKWSTAIEYAKNGLFEYTGLDMDAYEKAGQYDVNVRGTWKLSDKVNKYGTHYKNLSTLEAL